MRRKEMEQARAKELRAQGWALRRIACELDVALSSVSVWVRGIDPGRRGIATTVPTQLPAERLPLVSIPAVDGPTSLRRCGKCRLRTPCSNFGRHSKNGRQWWCKQCFRAYFAQRGQVHRDQVRAARNARRDEDRRLVTERLAAGCVDCGESDRTVLEFDHVGPKTANISDMVRNAVAPQRVREELDRCEVVCVNCHRRRTHGRSDNWWRSNPSRIADSKILSPWQKRNLSYVQAVLEDSVCVDCGIDDVLVLEFDHVFGKTGTVTVMAREGCSLNRLQDEVSRCDVRCANCHRRRTILEVRRRAAMQP